MGDVLIFFKNSEKLKLFDSQLNENKIVFTKENNAPVIIYGFKMINKIYYILYNNLCIENEEFFIKWYFKYNK